MKICLVTYADNIFKTILSEFEKSKSEYCLKHNLDFHYENIDSNLQFKAGWSKIDILLKYLKIYDYVFITDYDSVIIDSDYNIRELIELSDNSDVICSQLSNGFKLLGCSIFKSSYKTIFFLKYILRLRDNTKSFYAEELPFNSLIDNFKIKIHVENNINHIVNIHDDESKFMLHYAGISNAFKIKKMHEKRFNRAGQR
jgi:hypothetical protein